MSILTIALPIRQRARLVGRLKEHTVVSVATVAEALENLKAEAAELVVFVETDEDPEKALTTLLPHLQRSRVIFCAKQGHSSDFQNLLIKRLRVTAILHHPVDPDELVRRASMELDSKVPMLEARVAAPSVIPKALLPVWERHQDTNIQRVDILATVMAEAEPSEEYLEAGRRAAHQLAGSLGTFGLAAASLLAREAETLITSFATLSADQRKRLDKVVHALGLQIADPQLKLPDLENEAPNGSLLIYSIDPEWSQQFSDVARLAGYLPLLSDDPTGTRRVFGLEHPEKVLLDLVDIGQEGALLVHDLSGRGSVVALVDPDARTPLLACRTLPKSAATAEILQALEKAEVTQNAPVRHILAVDDDPIVLETLTALLQALNIQVHTLEDPLRFWETLAAVNPEIVMLDVDLPYVGGVELCRALRAEPKYAELPVIFLSAYNDSETVHRVFTAGADDYVFKPIIGPELITRTRNRLRRVRNAPALGTPQEVVKPTGTRPDVSLLLEDDELSRELFSQLSQKGLLVDKLSRSDSQLIERLTSDVNERPRVVLLDVAVANQVLQGFEGLGINNYCQIWVRGDLTDEGIVGVFEWGLAGYIPQEVATDVLVRKLERAALSAGAQPRT